MRTGALASGLGHGALIALAAFGVPWFAARERPPVRVSEVSFVTEAEFAAAQSAASQAPRAPDAPAEPPTIVEAEILPEPAPPLAEAPPPEPEPESEVATLAPAFDPAAPLAAAPESVSIVPPAAATLGRVAPPRSRQVERIDATPAPPPPEIARPAEAPVPELSAEPAPEPVEARPPEAPPEAAPAPPATSEPTPAEPPAPSGLVATADPPRKRPTPSRVASRETARTAAPAEPAPPATPPTPPTPAAVTPATPPTAPAATEVAATSLPVGPPITSGERDGLKLAVQRCWNVPAGLRDAQELKVTLAAELTPQGEVISGSIRLIEPAAAPDGRFQQAYEAGRRALIRCSPYDGLPREKFAQWRTIEVVFNPEGMVSW